MIGISRLFPLLLMILAWVGTEVCAHELRPALVTLSPSGSGTYVLRIKLNLEAVLAEVGPGHEDTADSPNARRYDALRRLSPEAFREEAQRAMPQLLSQLLVKDGGEARIDHDVASLDIPEVGDTGLARFSTLVLIPRRTPTGGVVTWSWSPSLGANIVRVDDPSRPEGYSAYLRNGARSEPIALQSGEPAGKSSVFLDYIAVGFTHIVPLGLDHILFVVGLFLLSPRVRPLAWQVTSFTVAHTVTLALGVLGLVTVSPAVVEPLIAASIVYVCIENLFSERLHRSRPVLVFVFGLLHGLGFATVLGEFGVAPSTLVVSLIGFNLGVELGQISVVVACFLLVGWFRDQPWYRRRLSIPGSLVVGLVGAFWLVERLIAL